MILWDTIALLGASLWLWMVMDALKPGLVSYYWNIQYHWIALMICIVFAFVFNNKESHFPKERVLPSTQTIIPYALGAGVTIALVLAPWGWAAVLLGLCTIFLISSLFYADPYDEIT